MRNCKNVKELDPITKLCPPCSTWHKNFNKKLVSTERQQTAREQVQNQNRNLSSSPHPPPAQPMAQGSAENIQRTDFPALSTTGSISAIAPPPIDVRSLQNSYNQLKNSSGSPVTLETLHGQTLDMFALMLNIHSKMSETDAFRNDVKKAHTRIDALEAKVGSMNEVSEKLGLAIRSLPLPPTGFSDLDMARQILAQIRAPGVDVNRDVVKAVRKIPAKPPHTNQPILGTVLVEMKNEESRAGIMKNKHSLQHHPDHTVKTIIIKNMKSREQMMIENLGNNILKRIPGCQNTFVTGNGQLREDVNKRPSQNPSRFQGRVQPPPNPRPQYNNSNQQLNQYSNHYQPINPFYRQQSYPDTQNQFQQNQVQTVFDKNNAVYSRHPPVQHHSSVPVPVPNFSTPPPPAVPQPQAAPAPTPLQDLLGNLESLYEQAPGPSIQTGPDLHQLQQAEPHYGYSEQLHQQPSQDMQCRQQDQVRGSYSDSD